MLSIIRTKFIRYDYTSALSLNRVELCVDSANELPAANAFDSMLLFQGSIAWDVSTGDFYGLRSDGTWYKQDGTGAYDPDSDAASNLNISGLNRPSVQPISDTFNMSPTSLNESDDTPIPEESEVNADDESLRGAETE